MNTEEINRQLNSIDCFVGTFSRDKLPDVNKYPAAVVINTDVSSRPGEHWVAVYFNSERQAEYFDSYGFPPLHIDIKRFIEKNSIGWCYNTVLLQAIDSITCGKYCVLFITLRSLGMPYCQFISLFTNKMTLNDTIVQRLFKEIYM
jgi:hypothetical protein